MVKEKIVDTLNPGNVFRDWLVDVLGERIHDKRCKVRVYKFPQASHTVCRYKFDGQDLSVVAKFYAEPRDQRRRYDPVKAMNKEFEVLKRLEKVIDIPRPIAIERDFNCVLVTEHINGESLYKFMKANNGLYDKLIAVAKVQRRLHDSTRSDYHKEKEFARFHRVLGQLHLNKSERETYDLMLGEWWYSDLLDMPYGCRIHNDPNPVNYLFNHKKVYAIDFESSWDHACFVHDLGIVAAELKHYFAMKKRDPQGAEPYIGHFIWNYSQDLEEFRRITRALPFFMSLGLLRMARLNLSFQHRQYILNEATACLRLHG